MHQFNIFNKHALKASSLPLIFLPGWGFSADILRLAPQFENHSLPWIMPQGMIDPFTISNDLHFFLLKNSISKVDVIGWSMGAYAAQNFGCQFPERTGRIILLAMRRQWPDEEINKIREELKNKPANCLRSFYRRCFLGNKKAQKQFAAEFEPAYLSTFNQDHLHLGLNFLSKSQPRQVEQKETFLLHGRRDIISPVQDMPDIANTRRTILNQAGHAIFLTDTFWQMVNPRHKISVRQRFSKAADTYEQHATIQKTAARLLEKKLAGLKIKKSILEIGCGTGTHTRFLASKWPEADIVALDFSAAMASQARTNLPSFAKVNFLCADGEQFLANPKNSFELITSNACFQWFENLEAAFKNMSQALAPGGIISCSMFGPRTLEELSQGLSEVLQQPISLPAASFPNPAIIRNALKKNFSAIQLEEKNLFRQYESFRDLLMQLRKTGTGGLQAPPLFTPSRIRRLDKWFYKKYGGYRLSYQLILFIAANKI